jgi:electron transport complex protein RnfG
MMLNDINTEAYENVNANAPAVKERPVKKPENEIVTLSFRLMIIIAAVVLMLAVVNALTKDKIAENEKKANDEARAALFPEATSFTPMSVSLSDDLAKYVGEIYEAAGGQGSSGYCVNVSNNGFGGKINMIVGVSTDGLITGVKVITHEETAGVGERIISNGSILSQFVNVSSSSISSVEAITGASVTSNAIIEGVKKALQAVAPIIDGGY